MLACCLPACYKARRPIPLTLIILGGVLAWLLHSYPIVLTHSLASTSPRPDKRLTRRPRSFYNYNAYWALAVQKCLERTNNYSESAACALPAVYWKPVTNYPTTWMATRQVPTPLGTWQGILKSVPVPCTNGQKATKNHQKRVRNKLRVSFWRL